MFSLLEDLWQACNENPQLVVRPKEVDKRPITGSEYLERLRWITLGYHYDWTNKVYRDEDWSPFPTELASLSSHYAKAVGYRGFVAEAAIVNYYHLDSTLSAHTDHSEENKTAPLVSISFGHSALFMLGGLSREDPAVAMWVRSGDCVIMDGPARLCYHGVPRIVEQTLPPFLSCAGPGWSAGHAKYMQRSRVNINTRMLHNEADLHLIRRPGAGPVC
eukprot:Colp12_sorted_trinity150504_noHs@13399